MPDNYNIPNLDTTANTAPASTAAAVPATVNIGSSTANTADPSSLKPTTMSPETVPTAPSIFNGNKGLLVAIVVVVIAAIIGISTFIGFSSSSGLEGLIKKVETETQKLQRGDK